MEYALPIVLLVVGFGLLVLEVFVPSLGLLMLSSLGCLVWSMVLGFRHGTGFGFALLASAAVGVPLVLFLAFKLFPRTPLGKHMILSGPKGLLGPVTRRRGGELEGKEGRTLSALRPSGIAEIEGRRLDVITRGEMVEPGIRVQVIESRGNRYVVRALESPVEDTEEEELR